VPSYWDSIVVTKLVLYVATILEPIVNYRNVALFLNEENNFNSSFFAFVQDDELGNCSFLLPAHKWIR